MARLEALLLCDLVVVAPDGKYQLQGVFEKIWAAALPAQHRSMWIYFRFFVNEDEPDGGQHTLTFILRRPSGTQERLPELQAQPSEGGKIEGNIQLQGLPLHEEGEHWFELYFDAEMVGSSRFAVERVTTGERSHETVH